MLGDAQSAKVLMISFRRQSKNLSSVFSSFINTKSTDISDYLEGHNGQVYGQQLNNKYLESELCKFYCS